MTEKVNHAEGSLKKISVLSGSWLKLIALITMIIDHIGLHLIRYIPEFNEVFFSVPEFNCSVYGIFRLIGRTAFPIYCFLIAEGTYYTRSRFKYGVNLFAFALISEIPWNLEHNNTIFYFGSQNVFFTLFLGFLSICIYERLREKPTRCIFALGALFIISWFLRADYGAFGMAFIFLLYLLRERRIAVCFIGSCIIHAAWKAVPAFIFIAMYNGQRGFIKGKFMKYFFYAVYPIHILIIWILKRKYFWF